MTTKHVLIPIGLTALLYNDDERYHNMYVDESLLTITQYPLDVEFLLVTDSKELSTQQLIATNSEFEVVEQSKNRLTLYLPATKCTYYYHVYTEDELEESNNNRFKSFMYDMYNNGLSPNHVPHFKYIYAYINIFGTDADYERFSKILTDNPKIFGTIDKPSKMLLSAMEALHLVAEF